MFLTYRHVGKIPVLPALAAAGALVVVGAIAVTILAILGVVACGTRLLRAFGLALPSRRLPLQRGATVEGIVVTRSSAGMLDR